MKRFGSLALALLLAVGLTVPAGAAGKSPNWNGPVGAGAGPHVCATGRDYILYYEVCGGMWRSSDGVNWTKLPERQWITDATLYSTGLNGLAHKEFQFLWTGTEYMMRQSLRDDPRETHRLYGDSPRNQMVTFLDAEFRILGVKAFDGPVTAIRCGGGTYYATVNGVEHPFQRADWDPGAPGGTCYEGVEWFVPQDGTAWAASRCLIRERAGDSSPFGLAVSTDGRSWVPLETKMTPDMMRVQETGGAVVYYCTYTGELWYWSGDGWSEAQLGFHPTEGVGSAWADYTFCWAGDGYLMCQSVTGRGMMGLGAGERSPRNTMVTFLDQNFHRTGEYDFGSNVTGVAWVGGVYYAQVAAEGGAEIWSSRDRTHWARTDLTALPEEEPVFPERVRTHRAGDQPAGGGVLRLADGALLYSRDGVYFLTLEQTDAAGVRVRQGSDGAVLEHLDENGGCTKITLLDWAEAEGRWYAAFGYAPVYITVDGTYVESVDVPFYPVSGCTMAPMRTLGAAMGLAFSYDGVTRTATCTREGLTVSVELGSVQATENGVTRTRLAVPAQMAQWRFCVPARFLAEAAGLDTQWDSETNTLCFTTPAASET